MIPYYGIGDVSGAERMESLRERRRRGVVAVVPVEVTEKHVAALLAAGHLSYDKKGDEIRVNKAEIHAAVEAYLGELI